MWRWNFIHVLCHIEQALSPFCLSEFELALIEWHFELDQLCPLVHCLLFHLIFLICPAFRCGIWHYKWAWQGVERHQLIALYKALEWVTILILKLDSQTLSQFLHGGHILHLE